MACESGCSGTCEGSCSGGCSSGCKGKCKGTCKGSCHSGCKGSCGGKCVGSCQTNCENECKQSCQLQCMAGQTIQSNPKRKHLVFNWTTTIAKNSTINIKATDWNSLGKKIKSASASDICGGSANQVQDNVSPGDIITSDIYNSYIYALNSVAKASLPPTKGSPNGTLIDSTKFVELSNALNQAKLVNITCCQLGEYCVQHCNNSTGPATRH